MELSQAISKRRSYRRFTGEPVTDQQLEAMFSAACQAPSGHNCQPWRFVAVRNRELIENFHPTVTSMKWAARVAVLIVVCVDRERVMHNVPGDRSLELYALQDTAAAIQNILLTATELGLGGCWMGVFDEDKCLEYLDLPTSWRPVAVLGLGHPEGDPRDKELRPLSDVVLYRD